MPNRNVTTASATDASGAPQFPFLTVNSWPGAIIAATAAVAGLTGVVALFGWASGIEELKSIVPGLSTMKANTAICFILCAASLALFSFGMSARQLSLGRALGLVAAAIGFVTLAEYVFNIDLGLDTLLFSATSEGGHTLPGRMSPPTALGFLCFGAVLTMPRNLTSRNAWAFVLLTHAGVALPTVAAAGYLFGMRALYSPTAYSSIALHTAVAFLALFAGLTATRGTIGWGRMLGDTGTGGILARRLLAGVILMPLALSWLVLQGVQQGIYEAAGAVAILAGSSILLLTVFVWTTVRRWQSLDEARRRQEELNRVVLQSAFDAFVLIDRDGRVMEWNPQAEKIFGWTRAEALGRDAADIFIPARARPMFQHGLRTYLATGAGPALHRQVEVRAVRRSGEEFPAELIVTPIRLGDDVVFSGFVRDVSEQRKTEEQLHQAQKMEAVGQLTGGIAHDFNNLLTVVVGRLDLALEKTQGPLRDSLQQALTAAEGGASLIKQLLAVSRKQTLAPRVIDINEMAGRMKELLQRSLGEHIELTMRLDDELWSAFADQGQVENALLNLAINARDAMPEGGKIVIETGNVVLDAAYAARNDEVQPGPYVMLAVSDTGTGMTADVIRRAFEPFFTTKEVGKGTGLGLAMVYGFAKQSRGHLKIYSEVGHGTTVRLYLPRHVSAATPAEKSLPAPAADTRGTGETVLVVEDDTEVREYVVAMLRELGYRVLMAATGPEAMKIVEGGEHIDLLFTDVIMPGGMTGRDLAAAAIRIRPEIRVLFTSGYSRDTVDKNGEFDPAERFLSKPYRRSDVAEKLREAFNGPRGAGTTASAAR
ncbi:MAG: PAS domain S-box protein [Alphaproteobacteria bacterium]|nr:PAS domain S-box protein [Alphaproteobacteria bacterium]